MKKLLLLALSGLFAASLAADEPKGAKPNIIAILADPPLPRFVFTLAATGTTEEKAETGNLKAETRWRFWTSLQFQIQHSQFKIDPVAGGVEFLGGLEYGFGTQGSPGVVSGEQGLEFPDDLFGGVFRDQIAFDLELERLLEPPGHGAAHSPKKL